MHNHIDSLRYSRLIRGLVGLGLVAVFALESSAQERREGRRRFDPSSFLQRLDRNGNKILEPEELEGRAQGFVANLGFDTATPIPIGSVMDKINRDRSEAETEQKTRDADAKRGDLLRLVPDFGEDVSLPGVVGFGEEGDSSATAGKPKSLDEVSDSVRSQVERVLRQYDENKNGALDANEIQNASWGQPSPEASDANRDGRLTQDELIARYESRERDTERMNSRDRDATASIDSNSPGGSGRGGDRGARENNRDSSARENSSRGGPTPPRSDNSSPPARAPRSSSSASASERIAGYVTSQLEKYDKNHSGSLDADELSAMSNAPKNADSDGNGELNRAELEVYYGGGYRGGASSGTSSENSRADSSKSETGSSDGAVRRVPNADQDGGSRRLRRRDTEFRRNGNSSDGSSDGTIKMSEFEPEEPWSEEKLKRFYELDANGDGVITPAEYNRRG